MVPQHLLVGQRAPCHRPIERKDIGVHDRGIQVSDYNGQHRQDRFIGMDCPELSKGTRRVVRCLSTNDSRPGQNHRRTPATKARWDGSPPSRVVSLCVAPILSFHVTPMYGANSRRIS